MHVYIPALCATSLYTGEGYTWPGAPGSFAAIQWARARGVFKSGGMEWWYVSVPIDRTQPSCILAPILVRKWQTLAKAFLSSVVYNHWICYQLAFPRRARLGIQQVQSPLRRCLCGAARGTPQVSPLSSSPPAILEWNCVHICARDFAMSAAHLWSHVRPLLPPLEGGLEDLLLPLYQASRCDGQLLA